MRDAVIVFGAAVRADGSPSGTLRRRCEGAIAVGRGLDDPAYVVTGGLGRYPPTEAQVMRDLLFAGGVAAERIIVEDQALDTLQSVRLCAPLLRDIPAGRVFVCSSGYHNPRCALLLRMSGFKTVIPPMPADRPVLGQRKWLYYCLREVPATLWDMLLLALRRA